MPAGRINQSWRPDEVEKLKAHVAAGLKTEAIAIALGRTYYSIKTQRERRRFHIEPKGAPRFDWPPEAIEFLQQKCTEAVSARQIAAALSEKYGRVFTRNTVIGKIDRLGIKRNLPERIDREPRRPRLPRGLVNLHRAKRRLELVWSAPQPFNGKGLPFAALDIGHCRYPLGEVCGIDTLFCGAPIARGSYCSGHHSICHQQRGASQ